MSAVKTKNKTRKKRVRKPLALLGWREWISLPDLGVDKISAKIDTGANTSSLYATHIKVIEINDEEFAKFRVTYGKPGHRKFSTTQAPLVGFRKVKSSSGETEERPVIKTSICIMGQCWKSEVTLTSRQSMQFPMLLGRACLKKRFIVDPSRANLSALQEISL
jgi:hypothetical protein|tara:strand:+ start:73 stop:561 length:489 start_codon:yes stop_codon:yes gene_type:complete